MKNLNTRDQLGPGLIIISLLLVVAGYIGGPALEKAEGNRRSAIFSSEFYDLRNIKDRQSQVLKQNLRLLGAQDLRLGDAPRGGFSPLYSQDLEDLLTATVAAVKDEIVDRLPARQYVVRARLRYHETTTSRVLDITRPGWSSMSAGLPAEALIDPEVFIDSNHYGGRRVDQIEFLVPPGLEQEESRRIREALETRFHASPLRRIDVAGNEYPIGVVADVTLTFDVEDLMIPVGILGTISRILNRIGLFGLLLLLVAPPAWVYLDARKRRLPAALWGLFALLTSALGALIYALGTREAGPACPECGERVSARFVVCPYCQTELKGTCSTCGQTVGLGWHYCPSCAAEL